MGTNFWKKEIEKEMANVCVSLEVLKGVTPENMKEGKIKPRFKYVRTHIIFDIKMYGEFTHKSGLVAGGNNTAPPSFITYSSVVTRESVRLTFIIYGLNDLYICACGIGNAYLNYTCRGKLWTKAGSEFGSEKGYASLLVRSLYGPKSSGSACISKLAVTLNSMGYKSNESDPDVWIKRATSQNGTSYYKYMLVYVDDVIHLAKDAQADMLMLNQVY